MMKLSHKLSIHFWNNRSNIENSPLREFFLITEGMIFAKRLLRNPDFFSHHCEWSEAIQIKIKRFDFYLDRHGFASRWLRFRSLLGELASAARLRGFKNQPPLSFEQYYKSNDYQFISSIWLSLDFIKQDRIQGVFILLFSTQWPKKHIMKSLMKRKQLRFLLKMRRNLIFDLYQLHWSCLELLDFHSGDMQTTISFLSDV